MKPLLYLLGALLFCCATPLCAQIYEEDFSTGFNGWTRIGGAASGWTEVVDGTAATLPSAAWNNRSAIRSISRDGALAYGNNGAGNGTVVSPSINLPGGTTSMWLSFYAYFRNENGGRGRVQIRDVATTDVVLTQPLYTNLTAGEETSSGFFHIIDLEDVLLNGTTDFQIEVIVDGATFFWLVDDFLVEVNQPVRPTFPRGVGQALTSFGVPFNVTERGAPIVPFQVVVDFGPAATPAVRQDIRQQLGVTLLDSCVCDRLELWGTSSGVFFDPVTGEPIGDPGMILCVILSSRPPGTIDDADFNFIVYNELQNVPPVPNGSIDPATVSALATPPSDPVRIAILDTGVDLDHPAFAGRFYTNDDPIGGGDDDNNCLEDDVLGWNFVDDNNNPDDDHGHGTHVAGIVVNNLTECSNCPFQLIPYKTHDSYGIGTLFSTACATLQASVEDSVDVINASWGFYGENTEILQRAVDTASLYGTLVVAAAGNDSLNLVADAQSPATYPFANVLGVGAYTEDGGMPERAQFSNYNADFLALFTPGTDIFSALPNGSFGLKTGTSMATPLATAAAALEVCKMRSDPADIRARVLDNATTVAALAPAVESGNTLNEAGNCDPSIFAAALDPAGVLDFCTCGQFGTSVIEIRSYANLNEVEIWAVNTFGAVVTSLELPTVLVGDTFSLDLRNEARGAYRIIVQTDDGTYGDEVIIR